MKLRRICGVLLAACLSAGSFTAFSAVPVSAAGSLKYMLYYTDDYTAVKAEPVNAGDKIYYTIDGSEPDTNSAVYSKKLGFLEATTLKLAEYDAAGNAVGKIKTVEIQRILPKPKFLSTDKFDGTVEVQITDAKEGAKIHYTIDGSDPTENSPVLEGHNLLVKGDSVIKAIAVMDGWKTSDIAKTEPLSIVTESSYEDYLLKCLELTNAERAKNGLPALKMNQKLCDASLLRAKELSTNYDNGHTRPNGKRWVTTLDEYGYVYRYASENYGKLDRTGVNPEMIIELWMNSENHRAAILNELGSDIGMGFYQVDGYCYWIQIFGELM